MKRSYMTQHILAALFLLPAAPGAAENSDESVFSPLTVSGNSRAENLTAGSSAAAYHKPGAFSSRNFNQNLQNTDQIIRSMPGSYTQIDQFQGMTTVNIRGMSGLGRVNTMVDGVTQTYFGQAPTYYHGGGNKDAGVLIDPAFLVSADVTRGNSSGGQGVNALAGSADMRTLGLDDVLRQGRQTGVLSRLSLGNNGLGRSAMITAAGKTRIFNTGSAGVLAGVSGSKSYGSYQNGAGEHSDSFFDYNTSYMDSQPRSQLYKFYFNPDKDNRLELSVRNFSNTYNRRDLLSTDYYLKYSLTPATELIDLEVLASNSRSRQVYQPESLYNFNNVTVKSSSGALKIENTSRFTVADTDVSWLYGGKLMNTRYTRTFRQKFVTESHGFAPAGTQKISALYTELSLTRGIYRLDSSVNHTRSRLQGYKPACYPDVICFPQGEAVLTVTAGSLNPSVTFSAQLTPWLEPFVNWNRSSRAPNVQELFFANEGGATINPFLKPEHGTAWQAGFNINQHDLFTDSDVFRLKALAYRTRIKDYITSESFFLLGHHLVPEYSREVKEDFNASISVNTPEPVTFRGYEIEAMYDTGLTYISVSWSNQHTDQPVSATSGIQLNFGYGSLSDLPQHYGTAELGVRLLDKKLTVGGLVKFTGKARRLDPWGLDTETGRTAKTDLPGVPAVIDIYSSFRVTKNIDLSLTVQNAANRNYADALNLVNQNLGKSRTDNSIPRSARGRTWLFGGQIRF